MRLLKMGKLISVGFGFGMIFSGTLMLAMFGWVIHPISAEDSSQTKKPIAEIVYPDYQDGFFNLLVNQYPDKPLVVEVFGPGTGSRCGGGTTTLLISYRINTVNIRYLAHEWPSSESVRCALVLMPFRYLIPLDVTLLTPGEITVNLMDQIRTTTLTQEMISAAKPIQIESDLSAVTIKSIEVLPNGVSDNEAGIRLVGSTDNACTDILGFIQYYEAGRIVLTPLVSSASSSCRDNTPKPLSRIYGIDLSYLPASQYVISIGDLTFNYWLEFGASRPLPPSSPAIDATPPSIDASWRFEWLMNTGS